MKTRRRLMMLGSVAAVGVTLVSLLGVFWILEIAPLVLFVGMAVIYGLLTNRQHGVTDASDSRVRSVSARANLFKAGDCS